MSLMGSLKHYKATRSNYLVEASYKQNINAQRVLLIGISKLNSKASELPKNGVRITVEEFAETYKDALDSKYAYEAFKEGAKYLYEGSISRIDGKKRTDTRWLSQKEEYQSHDGFVTLFFSPQLKPYLLDIKTRFLSIALREIAMLKSIYSVRLYEYILAVHGSTHITKKNKPITITIDELKDKFGIKKTYKWFDIKRRVLEVAKKELKKSGQLLIDYTPIKRGRSIVAVEIFYQLTDQIPMDV